MVIDYTVAVCLLLMLDPNETPSSAIDKIRRLRGPGAIQTVKVKLKIYHLVKNSWLPHDFQWL